MAWFTAVLYCGSVHIAYGPQICSQGLAHICAMDIRAVHMAWLTAVLESSDLSTWPGSQMCYGPLICSQGLAHSCAMDLFTWPGSEPCYGPRISLHGLPHSCAMDLGPVNMAHSCAMDLRFFHIAAQLCYEPRLCSHCPAHSCATDLGSVHMAWLTAMLRTLDLFIWPGSHRNSDLFKWPGSKLHFELWICSHGLVHSSAMDHGSVRMAWLTAASWTSNQRPSSQLCLWTSDLFTWPGSQLCYGPWICSHGLAHSCAMDRGSVHMTWLTAALWT